MRRRREYGSFSELPMSGWKARQAAAEAHNAKARAQAADTELRRILRDRDVARNGHAEAVQKRDDLRDRIARAAGKLASIRIMRRLGGEARTSIAALLDAERLAPTWMAQAEAEVERTRSVVHDAQARLDAAYAAYVAGMAEPMAALAAEPVDEPEPGPEPVDEPEPEPVVEVVAVPEPITEAPRGRGRPRKVVAT